MTVRPAHRDRPHRHRRPRPRGGHRLLPGGVRRRGAPPRGRRERRRGGGPHQGGRLLHPAHRRHPARLPDRQVDREAGRGPPPRRLPGRRLRRRPRGHGRGRRHRRSTRPRGPAAAAPPWPSSTPRAASAPSSSSSRSSARRYDALSAAIQAETTASSWAGIESPRRGARGPVAERSRRRSHPPRRRRAGRPGPSTSTPSAGAPPVRDDDQAGEGRLRAARPTGRSVDPRCRPTRWCDARPPPRRSGPGPRWRPRSAGGSGGGSSSGGGIGWKSTVGTSHEGGVDREGHQRRQRVRCAHDAGRQRWLSCRSTTTCDVVVAGTPHDHEQVALQVADGRPRSSPRRGSSCARRASTSGRSSPPERRATTPATNASSTPSSNSSAPSRVRTSASPRRRPFASEYTRRAVTADTSGILQERVGARPARSAAAARRPRPCAGQHLRRIHGGQLEAARQGRQRGGVRALGRGSWPSRRPIRCRRPSRRRRPAIPTRSAAGEPPAPWRGPRMVVLGHHGVGQPTSRVRCRAMQEPLEQLLADLHDAIEASEDGADNKDEHRPPGGRGGASPRRGRPRRRRRRPPRGGHALRGVTPQPRRRHRPGRRRAQRHRLVAALLPPPPRRRPVRSAPADERRRRRTSFQPPTAMRTTASTPSTRSTPATVAPSIAASTSAAPSATAA